MIILLQGKTIIAEYSADSGRISHAFFLKKHLKLLDNCIIIYAFMDISVCFRLKSTKIFEFNYFLIIRSLKTIPIETRHHKAA